MAERAFLHGESSRTTGAPNDRRSTLEDIDGVLID